MKTKSQVLQCYERIRNEEIEPSITIDLGRKVCHQAFLALSWVDDNGSDSEFFKEYVANDDEQVPSQAALLDDFPAWLESSYDREVSQVQVMLNMCGYVLYIDENVNLHLWGKFCFSF